MSIASLATILALIIASIAACACSHHQPAQKAETLTCHAQSHEEPTAESANTDSAKFSEQCNCVAQQPAPFISAKTETKRSKAEKNVVADLGFEQPNIVASLTAISDLQPPPTFSFYSGKFSYAGPSRAPPRL